LDQSSRLRPVRCWQERNCSREDCKAHGSEDLSCWLVPHASCPSGSTEIGQRLVSECASCPVYISNRDRAKGKRFADRAMIDTLQGLLAESAERAARLDRVEAESRSKSAQVVLLSEVGRALQRTMEIDQILLVILTAATAGDGLGFNRAFLLLADEAGINLTSRMAVGPSRADEAELIWKAMEDEGRSLGDILSRVSAKGRKRDAGIMRVAERLAVPIAARDNVIARCLADSTSYVADFTSGLPEAQSVASILGNDQFLVVPLVAEGKRLGVIVADNFITRRPIRGEDVRLLETFASQAALAILNASLHKGLQQRVEELERAHEELTVNHLQLVRAERLVAAGGLVATLIHDLKAPIVSIGLMAKAAASGLSGVNPVRETLESISREILRIEEYLRNFAQSAGKGTRKTETIDAGVLIDECLGVLRGLMGRGKIESIVSLGHGEAKLRGNRVEYRQVIVNLLHNAIEAMPGGGRITVSTAVERGLLRVSIQDTGKGIPEEDRARIFSPFFTTKPDGSGLGLVIAKRIVIGYGGRISVDSGESAGTCFSVHLPVAK
jgi:signal transduction histidine kinase